MRLTRECLALMVMVLTTACSASAAELYVSPDGSDNNPGTKEKPFATPERARDAARAMKKGGLPVGGITIRLRGGTYYLADTLVFTSADSGAKDRPVVYAAFPGETPVISGGRRISGWKKVSEFPKEIPIEARGKLWKADLPDVKAGKWRFMQLFADGIRCPRSRLPSKGYYTMVRPVGHLAFQYRPGQMPADSDAAGVEAVVFHRWDEARFLIRTVDDKKRIVHFRQPTVMSERIGKQRWFEYRIYYLENARAGLASPGQWHLDRTSGRLLFWPPEGTIPDKLRVVAPLLHHLIRFRGERENNTLAPVEHIHLFGIAFSHNEWPLDDNGFAGHWSDSARIDAAVVLERARNCRIERCRFEGLGTYAIKLGASVDHVDVLGNEIAGMGSGGILVRGIGPDIAKKGPQPNDAVFNTISDNHIHRLGLLYRSGVGILLSEVSDCRVSHNHIHDMDYIGIALGASDSYKNNPRGRRNVVEHNRIHDVMQLLSDGGGIYTYANCRDSALRNNLIHDSGGGPIPWQRAFGIHLDEPTTGILVEHNLVYRTRQAGMRWHKNRNVTVRNNIFAFGRESLLSANGNTGDNPFEQNVVYGSPKEFFEQMTQWSYKTQFRADQNVYWDPRKDRQPAFPVRGGSFETWQAAGADKHSAIGDPMFVDPEKGDFRFQPGSPALKLGIRQPDIADAGPRPKDKRGRSDD